MVRAGARSTRPASGSSIAGEHAQQRRLADAVRADHAEALAGRDRQRHVDEDRRPAARDGDRSRGQHASTLRYRRLRSRLVRVATRSSHAAARRSVRAAARRRPSRSARTSSSGASRAPDAIRADEPSGRAPRAHSRTWPTSSARWNVMRSRTASGTSSRSGPLRAGQDHRGEPGPLGREHLLLDAADRQHPALQRDLAGHADVAAHRPLRELRHDRGRHRDAGRRPVLRDRARGDVHVEPPAAEPLGVDAEVAGVRGHVARARCAPTPS